MKWCINNNILSLDLEDGNVIVPSARQIYEAESTRRTSVNGLEVTRKPSEDLKDMKFSRYPLDLFLVVNPPKAELSLPAHCNVVGIHSEVRVYINHLTAGMPDHILTDKTWYPLVRETIDEFMAILTNNKISVPGDLTLKKYLELRKRYSEWLIIEEHLEAAENIPKPSTVSSHVLFNGHLYPYQEIGYMWLSAIAEEELGCILADEMGLGKTVQVIALLCRQKEEGKGPSLIIAPATILENWKREIAKFAPRLTAMIHRGSDRTGFPSDLGGIDITITSYETVVRDLSLMEMLKWNIVVVDEAQAIKNPSAHRTEVIKQIPRRVAIAVTGTPLENHLSDLWSVTDFAIPNLLGDISTFRYTYTDDVEGAIAVEPVITPILLRRRVAEVAGDLPSRIDVPQCIELTEEMAIQYETLRREIIGRYGTKPSFGGLTKLRMFCTHPFLLEESDGDPAVHCSKYTRLTEILEEIFLNNEKVLIFTSYTKMIDLLVRDVANRFGVYTDFIDGRVNVEERQPKIDRFGKQPGAAILVLNPKAGGTGLNIVYANHVIHYNLEWNPAVEDQASARVYRHGQTLPVTIHRLYYLNTVEEIIDQRIRKKREMSEHAIIEHEGKPDDLGDIVRALEISPLLKEAAHDTERR